ncbi:MAG: c-type cytochrome [Acidobacteria bacterium]|nr:c-type cytochrome [Acidobacteriota bacterium]
MKKITVTTAVKTLVLVVVVAALGGAIALAYFIGGGVSARPQPGRVETFAARTVRNMAIVWHAPDQQDPAPNTEQALAEGRAHFADHCASCHANDGSGNTEIGRGLYPRAPDMRLAATQDLSDHQLFYIIENGIRLTGMPGWSTGTAEGETASWQLVRVIRRLPMLTSEEIEQMEALNPRSPEAIRQEIEAERFLRGDDSEPPAQSESGDAHVHK